MTGTSGPNTDVLGERTAAEASPPRDAQRGRVFAILATSQVIVILAMSMLSIALPDIQGSLRSSTPELALMTASYGMSFSGLLLLGGRIADSWGGRRTLLLGVALLFVGSLISLLAPSTWVMLAGRFLQGGGAALIVPSAMTLVRALYPDVRGYTRAMAIWGVLAGLGGVIGLIYGALIVTVTSWRLTFLLPMAVCVAVVLLRNHFPATVRSGRSGFDWWGAVTITLAMTFLSYGLVVAPEQGWLSLTVLVSLIAGVVFLIAFGVAENVVPNPLLPLKLFATPRRMGAFASIFLCAAGITTIYYELSLYFRNNLDWSPLQSALGFVPLGLALVITSFFANRLLVRIGAVRVLALGMMTAGVGAWFVGSIADSSGYAGWLVAGFIVMPVGIALIFSSATVLATQDADPQRSGLVGAALNGAMEMGATLGLALLVSLAGIVSGFQKLPESDVALSAGFGYSLRAAGAAFLIGAVVTALWAVRRDKHHDASPHPHEEYERK